MANQTPNFNFDLRESADIFNPLSTNANFESLDTILKNLQETGGITTYTTTAAANLLKLSGTPKVNDTVFKFVAAGDANTWTGASGGVINKIVGLDGVQKMISGGNLYVAWVNATNSMVVIAWPDVVNAQTFDGKGPTEWATKVQLNAVNETAGNAVTTAQAAATVANQALDVAKAAGFDPVLLWTNPAPSRSIANGYEYPINKQLTEYKWLLIVSLCAGTDAYMHFITVPNLGDESSTEYTAGQHCCISGVYTDGSDVAAMTRGFERYTATTLTDDGAANSSNTSLIQKTASLIPWKIYGIK